MARLAQQIVNAARPAQRTTVTAADLQRLMIPGHHRVHGLLAQPDCTHCPLRTAKKVFPDGPVPAKIAFVGEGPGKVEEQRGSGFQGDSGQLLWLLCRSVGIPRDAVWVTNAAICRPREVRLASGVVLPLKRVKELSVACCRRRLVEELCRVNPTVIVPMGNAALWALSDIPHGRITEYRGGRLEVDLPVLLQKIVTGNVRSTVPDLPGD